MVAAQADPAATPPSSGQATTVDPVTAKANAEDKIVCKTDTPTGSRLGAKRTCMKKSDWARQAQIQSDQVRYRPPAGIGGVK